MQEEIAKTVDELSERLNFSKKGIKIVVIDTRILDEWKFKAAVILASRSPLTEETVQTIMGMGF